VDPVYNERRQPPRTQQFDLYHPVAHANTCSISFTYPPVASMWVVALHSLFLYSDPPLPCHPPSYWLRLFLSQTFSNINTRTFLKPIHSSHLPTYEDGTDSVPKCRRIKFKSGGITQKKAYNIQNTAKVWNKKCTIISQIITPLHVSTLSCHPQAACNQ